MNQIADALVITADQQETLDKFDLNQADHSDNVKFSFTDDSLEIHGLYSIDMSAIKQHLSPKIFDVLKDCVSKLIEDGVYSDYSIGYSYVTSINTYFKLTQAKGFTLKPLLILHEKCCSHEIAHTHFGCVRSVLKHWHKQGLPYVDDTLIDHLTELGAPKAKRSSGSRVRSDDPAEGWYTEKEYNDIIKQTWKSFEEGKESLWNATAILLSAQYGRRPAQMAHLKIGDLKSIGESLNVSGRRIEFPGAKDRSSNGFRQSKIEVHSIGADLWRLCQLLTAQSIAIYEERLQRKLTNQQTRKLPLFHVRKTDAIDERIKQASKLTNSFDDLVASQILHSRDGRLSAAIMKGPAGKVIQSDRTLEPLVQNAYRFRYTRARQLARMGVPKTVLSYWLGHENDKSLDAYYDDPAERAKVLNEYVAPLLAPLAQAFQGKLRDSEQDAERGNDPTSRIEVDGRDDKGVGTCGEHGFCHASVPIPCYRCTKFQPWVYGPHHEVLTRLLERQQAENEVPRPGQKRRLLLPVQLDKDIKAVREVIALCEARKQALEAENE